MSGTGREPWETGKVVKKSLKAKSFRKVDKRDIREVEIEVVRAPLVRAPAGPSNLGELPPPKPAAPPPAPRMPPAFLTEEPAGPDVKQTPPQAIPLTGTQAAAAGTAGTTQAALSVQPATGAAAPGATALPPMPAPALPEGATVRAASASHGAPRSGGPYAPAATGRAKSSHSKKGSGVSEPMQDPAHNGSPRATAGQALAPQAAAAIPFAVATGALEASSRAMRGESVTVRETHAVPRGAETQTMPSMAHDRKAIDGSAVHGAMLAVCDALYKDIGQPGSILSTPKGVAFSLRSSLAAGEVHTQRQLTVPLPDGHTTSHPAALAIDLENGAHLVLDVLSSTASLTEVKAHAFDALQFRRNSRSYTVLVFVRIDAPGGLTQEQVTPIAHGYDLVFGIDEEHARTEMRYGALRSQVATWLAAAGKA